MAPLGLYLHIPFCASLCGYCTFTRSRLDDDLRRAYVHALEREIRESGAGGDPARAPADTLYFGGGTPSLLEPAEVRRLVAACRDEFALDLAAEITLEANPESVDAARLAGFREAGINRLSLGVQSFRDEELARLGRVHTTHRARAAGAEARAAGFENVSLDLMMGLPGQSLDEWLASVDELIALSPAHASLYLLELHDHVPFGRESARRGFTPLGDDEAADMYLAGMERVEGAGLCQYEISSVARPGQESRHNLKYWTDGDWIGFGCGAHSTRNGIRWKNVPGTGDYIDRVVTGQGPAVERQVMTARQRLEDALFMGLRLTAGVDADALGAQYGAAAWACCGDRLAPFVEAGLLVREAGRLRLTRPGMLLASEVMMSFV